MIAATEHAFAAEDIMALLDGELPGSQAQDVSAHIKECTECASLVEQLRSTSRALAGWTIPSAPDSLDNAVVDRSGKAVAKSALKRPLPLARGFGRWPVWAVGGGAIAAVLLVIGSAHRISTNADQELARKTEKSRQAVSVEAIAAPQQAAAFSSGVAGEPGQVGVAGMITDSVQPADRRTEMQNNALSQPTAAAGAPNPAGPMIARTVSLTIVVKDIAGARTALDAILARNQGYTAQLNLDTPEGAARSFTASLRIPASQLAATLASLRELGRVQNESQFGEEVTQQHANLVARLRNARETEQRLLAILQQRTGKVEEVLQVEEQISSTRGQIEQMEAEQKELEHRVDYAAVQLQLSDVFQARLAAPSFSVGARMHNALVNGVSGAGNTLLGIVLFLEEYGPVLLVWLVILGVPGWFLWRRYRRVMAGV